jgi:hypothetical protein
VVRPNTSPAPLLLFPTGVGESKPLFQDSINHLWGRWLPDGKHMVFSGNEAGHGFRSPARCPMRCRQAGLRMDGFGSNARAPAGAPA